MSSEYHNLWHVNIVVESKLWTISVSKIYVYMHESSMLKVI